MKINIGMQNKEYGSDFHYALDSILTNEPSFFDSPDFVFSFSGRSALYGLIEQGIDLYNWERIYFPSYYCHPVVDFIKHLPIDTFYYDCNPFEFIEDIDIIDDYESVVINVDFFGLRKLNLDSIEKAVVIDDLTHNIAAIYDSNAHYCFGSLRKELPIPVGGFCYSPKKLSLPVLNFNLKSDLLASQKFAAMILKREYLEENLHDKSIYRNLFEKSEAGFEELYTNSILTEWVKSLLFKLDIKKINEIKQGNIKIAVNRLKGIDKLRVNFNESKQSFGLVLECESKIIKEKLKYFLVKNRIYPAVLWPNQLNVRNRTGADKMLFLHMDYRYTPNNIEAIICNIKEFFKYE